MVQHLIQSFQRSSGSAVAKTFRVNYKRHVLTMDDLGTLYGQNWLNDQVLVHRCVPVQEASGVSESEIFMGPFQLLSVQFSH